MNKCFFCVALVVGSVASIGNLPAQDNQNSNTKQATLEDRTDRLEQGEQDLKGQIEQLRGDVADLQDRLSRLEGGQRPAQAPPPPPAKSSGSRRTGSTEGPNAEAGTGQEQSFDVFYQGLQSGGHWFDDPTYGYVWQPDVAISDENWHPYSDGHWAYTDRGWTWISTEDFGWATYHYGRWARRSDNGWIWIPGSEWAPAWVSWRQSKDHVGWAPLPPEVADDSQIRVEGWVDNYYDIGPSAYVFVTTSDLARPTYRDVIVPSDQNAAFLTQTRNVTNIANGNNGVTVNGPAYEQLASQVNIPQYKLHYVTENQGRFGTSTRGNELQVMAPPATLQRNATVQPKVEKQLAQAELDHGWQRIDQAKATQLKQTMEKQAPVPANLPPKPAAPKPLMGATQNQPAQTTREQQPAGNMATPAPRPNQPRPATQQGTPQGATPAPAAGAPPQPEATPARPGTEEARPTAPTSEQNKQMRAPTPGAANKIGEETRQPATPSPSPKRSPEQREHRQEVPSPHQLPSAEPTPSKEQLKRETQGSNEPAREQPNEAPKRVEPGSRPSGNDQDSTARQRQENRREEPGTKTERPAEPPQQPEAGRAVEKKEPEQRNPDINKNQIREGTGEEKPRKEESPSKQRGNQREKQGGE